MAKEEKAMSRLLAIADEKAQKREITITSYSAGLDKVVMEGTLIDRRFTENYLLTGEKRPVGVFHHMVLRLLINKLSRRIEDVEVKFVKVPRDDCEKIKDSFDSLKGEYITKGFVRRIQLLVGGEKSCVHLRTLLISMSSTVVQGIYAIQSRKSFDFQQTINNPEIEKAILGTIQNTCFVWRENGPEFQRVLKMINDERSKND